MLPAFFLARNGEPPAFATLRHSTEIAEPHSPERLRLARRYRDPEATGLDRDNKERGRDRDGSPLETPSQPHRGRPERPLCPVNRAAVLRRTTRTGSSDLASRQIPGAGAPLRACPASAKPVRIDKQ